MKSPSEMVVVVYKETRARLSTALLVTRRRRSASDRNNIRCFRDILRELRSEYGLS